MSDDLPRSPHFPLPFRKLCRCTLTHGKRCFSKGAACVALDLHRPKWSVELERIAAAEREGSGKAAEVRFGERPVARSSPHSRALMLILLEGTIPANPTDGIGFLREPNRDPAVLTAFEVRRLFGDVAAHDDRHRARDLAILALLSQLGLRVHELVGLNVAQIDAASATLVAVRGKNDSTHDLPLNAKTIALVRGWLAERAKTAPADETALFISSRGNRLSCRDVQRFLEKLRKRIGSAKKITPHTLRHSAATLALTMGVDLATVGELLRHQSLNTTRKYLHLVVSFSEKYSIFLY